MIFVRIERKVNEVAKIAVVLHRLHDRLIPVWQAPRNMTVNAIIVHQYNMANLVLNTLDKGYDPVETCTILNIGSEEYMFRLYTGNPDNEGAVAQQHANAITDSFNDSLLNDISFSSGVDLSSHFSGIQARDEPSTASREKPLDDDLAGRLDNLLD